jgi:hypothetical protein
MYVHLRVYVCMYVCMYAWSEFDVIFKEKDAPQHAWYYF